MNTMSLAKLYRRATAHSADRPLDAQALLAVLAGRPAEADRRAEATRALAESAAHADLARMLGELQADSEALAAQVQRVRAPALAHRGRAPARPHARVVSLRWVGSLAACLVLAVGAFMLHERGAEPHAGGTLAGVTAGSPVAVGHDRIFASGEELRPAAATPAPGDRLFHSDFSGGS